MRLIYIATIESKSADFMRNKRCSFSSEQTPKQQIYIELKAD